MHGMKRLRLNADLVYTSGPQMLMHKQQLQNGAEMEGNRQRAQSPGSGEGAPSPSKRQRLDNGPFPSQPGMVNGGRGQPISGQGENHASNHLYEES